ncbi:MAG: hypothetical protein R3D27_12210 [Hyphomicrobiaceae bacterium]
MSMHFAGGFAGNVRAALRLPRPARLADVNGMALAIAALGLTIATTTLSEARFREADARQARVEALAKAVPAAMRYCQRTDARVEEPRS